MAAAALLLATTASAATAIRINSGGDAYTDSQGRAWLADTNFIGGGLFDTSASIGGTLENTLYQTERYGDFSYRIPVTNGNYQVVLHLAEIYWDESGRRVFDVAAEGQPAYTNVDIWVLVGRYVATTQTLAVTVTDGFIDLDFSPIVDNAKVSAIEVIDLTPASPEPLLQRTPTSLAFGNVEIGQTSSPSAIQLRNSGTAPLTISSITLTGSDAAEFSLIGASPVNLGTGDFVNVDVDFSPLTAGARNAAVEIVSDAASSPDEVPLSGTGTPPLADATVRINVGGGTYVDGSGALWAADQHFTDGNTHATGASIANTVDDALYQSERYGAFSYRIPISNGTYRLTLHFAEIYFTASGKRVFDVLVEGLLAVNDLDIWQSAGANAAYTREVVVTVLDNALEIVLAGSVNHAKLSAIEVAPDEGFSAGLFTAPPYLNFGAVTAGAQSAYADVTMVNTGSSVLSIFDVQLTGGSAAQFKSTGVGAVLPEPRRHRHRERGVRAVTLRGTRRDG
ncbi:MAG: malectin domain-containing carbohydrate-binding protein [Verrucomicrobia bacterium]|nr:malectin domain-containing carbohydrate-binding protein [Verrucomicrobiota bacterium]MDA1088352.1 malectin domain-containing carbohydrate-binding protein [Verrucomicrobiota bacterium]